MSLIQSIEDMNRTKNWPSFKLEEVPLPGWDIDFSCLWTWSNNSSWVLSVLTFELWLRRLLSSLPVEGLGTCYPHNHVSRFLILNLLLHVCVCRHTPLVLFLWGTLTNTLELKQLGCKEKKTQEMKEEAWDGFQTNRIAMGTRALEPDLGSSPGSTRQLLIIGPSLDLWTSFVSSSKMKIQWSHQYKESI